MANLAATTITGALDVTSTITGPASGASALNASNVSSGTLASDRLPTVPTTKGGTGLTSIGSADQVLKVNSGGTALEFGDAGGGVSDVRMRVFQSSTTYTPTSGTQFVTVYAVGGGGGGGTINNNTGRNARGSGGSGGGGGTAIRTYNSTELGATAAITIGAGGAGGPGAAGAGTEADGSAGGNTTFNPAGTGTTITGNGGGLGQGEISNDTNPAEFGICGTGGSASGGQVNSRGGAAFTMHAGTNSTNDGTFSGQNGGSSFFSSTETNFLSATGGAAGNDGSFGSGGNGAVCYTGINNTRFAGGDGGTGAVIILEYA